MSQITNCLKPTSTFQTAFEKMLSRTMMSNSAMLTAILSWLWMGHSWELLLRGDLSSVSNLCLSLCFICAIRCFLLMLSDNVCCRNNIFRMIPKVMRIDPEHAPAALIPSSTGVLPFSPLDSLWILLELLVRDPSIWWTFRTFFLKLLIRWSPHCYFSLLNTGGICAIRYVPEFRVGFVDSTAFLFCTHVLGELCSNILQL